MKSIKIFIVLGVLFTFASTLAFAQNGKELNNKGKTIPINIDIVKVDSKFYTLIDSLLYYERKCSYYSDTLTYGIWIERNIANNGDSVIVISINVNSEKHFLLMIMKKRHLLDTVLIKGILSFSLVVMIYYSSQQIKRKSLRFHNIFLRKMIDGLGIYFYIIETSLYYMRK